MDWAASYLLKTAAPMGRLLKAPLPEFQHALLRLHGRTPPIDDAYFREAFRGLMTKDTPRLRQRAVQALREMRQGAPYTELYQSADVDPYFLKQLPKLVQTKPVPVIHGGHVPGLQGMIRYGPRGMLNNPITGAAGRPERFGAYLFPGSERWLSEADVYARRAAGTWGARPGILKFNIPEGLLEPGRQALNMTPGELAIPRSFWQYASQPEIL